MKCLRSSKWSCNLMFYLLISSMCLPETFFYLFIFFIFSSLLIYLPGTLGQVGGQDLQRWNAWDWFKDPRTGHTSESIISKRKHWTSPVHWEIFFHGFSTNNQDNTKAGAPKQEMPQHHLWCASSSCSSKVTPTSSTPILILVGRAT